MVAVIAVLVFWLFLTWRMEMRVDERYEAAIAHNEAEAVQPYVPEDDREMGSTTKDVAGSDHNRELEKQS